MAAINLLDLKISGHSLAARPPMSALGPIAGVAVVWMPETPEVRAMVGRGILILSAAMLLLFGGTGLFAAQEAATWLGVRDAGPASVSVQIAASAMLGLAMMNWYSRNNRVGGIYARPLCLANLLFFASSALSIGKAVAAKQLPVGWLALAAGFSALGLAFAWLAFLHDPLERSARG